VADTLPTDGIETEETWTLAKDNKHFAPPSVIFDSLQIPIVTCWSYIYDTSSNVDFDARFGHSGPEYDLDWETSDNINDQDDSELKSTVVLQTPAKHLASDSDEYDGLRNDFFDNYSNATNSPCAVLPLTFGSDNDEDDGVTDSDDMADGQTPRQKVVLIDDEEESGSDTESDAAVSGYLVSRRKMLVIDDDENRSDNNDDAHKEKKRTNKSTKEIESPHVTDDVHPVSRPHKRTCPVKPTVISEYTPLAPKSSLTYDDFPRACDQLVMDTIISNFKDEKLKVSGALLDRLDIKTIITPNELITGLGLGLGLG
jgi:hypothetical protein